MFDFSYLEFDWLRFAAVVIVTLLGSSWIFFLENVKDKIYYFLFYFFIFLYCGLGWSYSDAEPVYFLYYILFLLFFSLTLWLFRNKKKEVMDSDFEDFLGDILKKYAPIIIVFFLALNLLEMLVPENKILKLLSPPTPDLRSSLEGRIFNEGGRTAVEAVIYYLKSFLLPFFLFSLYHFRKKIVLLCILFFLPLYMEYCRNAYMGRSTVMVYLLAFILFIYYDRPNIRRYILLGGLLGIPIIAIPLQLYVEYRLTGFIVFDVSGLSDIYSDLFRQETFYPLLFDMIMNYEDTMISPYLQWLVTLPLPGFLKSVDAYSFNFLFSEYILGIDRTDYGFCVVLPGVVGEAVFLFGKYLFCLYAVIAGLIISIPVRFLRAEKESLLFLYSVASCPYVMARGGTVSMYPFIIKSVLLYVIFRNLYWYIQRKSADAMVESNVNCNQR